MPKLTPEERVNAQLMSLYTAVMCSLACNFVAWAATITLPQKNCQNSLGDL
jgi:hypothetical protein